MYIKILSEKVHKARMSQRTNNSQLYATERNIPIYAQSTSIPIERPSPGTRALLDLVGTLIFSRTMDVSCTSMEIGLTNLIEVFSPNFLRR